ncbi:MAG: hypothetical protein JNK61_01535 [Bacteroidia bacterium]|nr:hypothetical protein [Bacteroidia bacterium]HQV00171.1 hypothetical protein [Bacteroidia bacterium]
MIFNKVRLFAISVGIIIVAGCNENSKLQKEIAQKESELKNDTTGVVNYAKAQQMIDLYISYARLNPVDTISAYYLFKAADVAAHAHQPQLALNLYDSVIINFPKYNGVADAYFFKAFLLDNVQYDKVKASEAYQQLLVKFPNYHQAESVRWLLQNMYKTDLEIAHELIGKQNDSIQ